MQITDDLNKLLDILPDRIRDVLVNHPLLHNLIEIVMDLGRQPEARFVDQVEYVSDQVVTQEDLDYCVDGVGDFGGDNRAGIERTLHRISCIRNRRGEVVGLTCRVGRAVFGTIGMIRDLVETGKSILMLGRPGVGKTTALREIARVLADDLGKRVIIIDTSNEIAGDGDIPHPAIGRARRMQVSTPELQHHVMIEAVENHTPEVIVIDEISTELEALAARTIAERGVQLVGTAHGNRIENLMKNPSLSDLIGGIQAVTLGDDEARRRGSQKTVLERKAPPTFEIAVEMLERERWVIHEQVAVSIDSLLRGMKPKLQVRTVDKNGEFQTSYEPATAPLATGRGAGMRLAETNPISGFLADGKMLPLPTANIEWENQIERLGSGRKNRDISPRKNPARMTDIPVSLSQQFEQLLDQSLHQAESSEDVTEWSDLATDMAYQNKWEGKDLPLHIYSYGIARDQIEQVIQTLHLPVVLTKDIDGSDVVLAVRSHVRKQSKIRQVAKIHQVPLHTIKAGTLPQIARALRRLLNMEDPSAPEVPDLRLFVKNGVEDEIEALEEARLAVEQIVIPKGQPVELLPRSPQIRKIQHELVEHYHLKSQSFGEEPNRRLRIYPA